jgi:hypothetical protein
MYRLKPYSRKEWEEIEPQGFFRFYLEYIVDTMILGLALFAVLDLIVNFGQQTELMQMGYLMAVVFPLVGGLLLWGLLKRKYRLQS